MPIAADPAIYPGLALSNVVIREASTGAYIRYHGICQIRQIRLGAANRQRLAALKLCNISEHAVSMHFQHLSQFHRSTRF